MRIPERSLWIIAPVLLTLETALCAVLAAAILDGFVRRPQVGGGSITTLLPGFVYAGATVMKVCLVSAIAAAIVGLVWRLATRAPSKQCSTVLPVWGIASIAVTPATMLLGALAVLVGQSLLEGQNVTWPGHFSQIARSAVFVMLVFIFAGVMAAIASLIRREQPSLLPILGLIGNLVLICLFLHFRFYALGFDQDLWAPR
jgi:hypothetical protein